MKCPFCHTDNDRVIDSRASEDGFATRRRRECLDCRRRYTTYERVERTNVKVVKKDGARLPFDRDKEGLAVLTFAEGLRIGGESFLGDPVGNPEIPNWTRITSTLPEFLTHMKRSVDEDNL